MLSRLLIICTYCLGPNDVQMLDCVDLSPHKVCRTRGLGLFPVQNTGFHWESNWLFNWLHYRCHYESLRSRFASMNRCRAEKASLFECWVVETSGLTLNLRESMSSIYFQPMHVLHFSHEMFIRFFCCPQFLMRLSEESLTVQ